MEKGIIVVDVDGVLCDLVASAIPVINNRYHCNLKRSDIRMFEMDRCVGVEKAHFNEIFKHLDYTRMKSIDGAAEGLAHLANRFRIVVATSRPPELHGVTTKWLHDNGLLFDAFMSTSEEGPTAKVKSDLYPLAEAVIDDDLREVIAASASTRIACLLDAPWNHSINAEQRFLRCHDWAELVDACINGAPVGC